jgi:hypothetical protein
VQPLRGCGGNLGGPFSTDMEPLTGFLNIENKHVGRPLALRAMPGNKRTSSYHPEICIPTFIQATNIMKQTTTVNANNNAIIHLLCAIANTNVANLTILATINSAIKKGPINMSSTNSFPISKHKISLAKKQSIEHTLTTGATHQYFNIKSDISLIFNFFFAKIQFTLMYNY